MMKRSFQDPLFSMEMVCDHLNISSSYLTSLFKRYSTSSFNKCLVKLRIDKASELLLNTPLKIYEIAQWWDTMMCIISLIPLKNKQG
ncbi:MAG: AraC family transcriptional regulator [Erysipelotrichaceae bacterium]|nr:AraC family transcriptional regulator [Erysipelotrichaceae bacterium]